MTPAPQSPWSNPPGTRAVFLLDTSSELERKIAQDWINATRPVNGTGAAISQEVDISGWLAEKDSLVVQTLSGLVAGADETLFFIPVRVLWFPRAINGERRARFRDLLLGDPHHPFPLRQKLIYRKDPDRCYPVVGAGSTLGDLVSRFDEMGINLHSEVSAKAEFILRMAILALERTERNERGARYKVPRLVSDVITSNADFAHALEKIAIENQLTPEAALKRAQSCLKEMAADHQTLFIDMLVSIARAACRRGYNEQIEYLQEDVTRIRELTQQYPVAFLMTHKTYLDGMVMANLVYELDLPPLHLVGGANLDFALVGALSRKAGTVFIRRSFQDDPVYRLVIRHYFKYLVSKRFPLNWAFEGTRSRTGKLMPPRLGLLRYVADAAIELEDTPVHLIPVSIAYDQLPDVSDYISEHSGAEKKQESLSWVGKYLSKLSQPFGRIHVRFGEAVIVDRSEAHNVDGAWQLDQLALQKLAFRVAVEANRVTPVTLTSLIVFSLLKNGYQALTLAELRYELGGLEKLINLFEFPKIGNFDLGNTAALTDTLHALGKNRILVCYEEGLEPVYAVAAGSKVAAAYYRNNVVHFFVHSAIAELALLSASESTKPSVEAFRDEALKLRDLLKFEFFFEEKELFITEIERNLDQRLTNWRTQVQSVSVELELSDPIVAHGTLRTIFEAYRIAAEVLQLVRQDDVVDKKSFVNRCVTLGRQMVLQQRVASEDALTKVYFENAFMLAQSRGLVEDMDTAPRKVFAHELAVLCDRLDYLAVIANGRRIQYRKSANQLNDHSDVPARTTERLIP